MAPTSSEWFLPSYAQARALGFSLEKNGSAGVLDFVHKDKTTLSYVRLHSAEQPGRFGLIDNYKLVFCGTVASEVDFTRLLLEHKWQDPGAPVEKAPKKEKEEGQPERPRPEPPHPTAWREGALALLAGMTPEGQARTLASWAEIGKVAGGPFAPVLPSRPAVAVAPLASGLLDCFTVLDLEFQGTQILELAAIRYEHWQAVEEYESLVYFDGPLNGWITSNTKITSARLRQAPDEKTVLREFFRLAEGSILVAHNALAADKRVLEAARTRCGATAPLPNPWFCTMAEARRRVATGLLKADQKCGISDLCTLFSIDQSGHHTAKRDVEMCHQVLHKLHAQQPITELITSLAKPKKPAQASLFATAA